jgi:NAD(P)-dependent dehydrogenase (short-subunit alcohol dehydrogenase family)
MTSHDIKSVLITGASAGIGKEIARQLASNKNITTIYLACRNEKKALAVKRELETQTKRSIFKIVIVDVANLASVRALLSSLHEPIDAVVLNAGGSGGKTPMSLTSDGVTYLFAQNVLGHVVLLEGMLASGQLTKTAIFAGSEGARGVPKMGIKRPALRTSSADDFADIITGKAYAGQKLDVFTAYGNAKYVGVQWMSSLARRFPDQRIVSVSPGGTQGTEAANDLPGPMRFFYNNIYLPVLAPLFGLAHSLETGAKRMVNAVTDESQLSGHFYASKANTLTGPLVDQREIFADLGNPTIQDHAAEAIYRFTRKS